ncbi:MAG: hypothetical protein MT490_09585 [Sphingomonas sp.]|uniref:M56 family metallopeptidase n=1 Tax=Sphingomonas sp. TaxID=28214 RepID=UPI002274E886|nr:M56 family metallopeptidase [Sphingomonas sp.]MCX8476034.1 hypothetical protein [Sphingomonas sp.]
MLALLIDLGWKSTLIAVAALAGVQALGGRSAAERVLLLRVALAALFALPIFVTVLPALEFALLPAAREAAVPLTAAMAAGPMPVPAMPSRPAGPDADAIVTALYMAGVALLLAHMAVGVWTLRRWTRSAEASRDPAWLAAISGPSRLRRPVQLRVSPQVASPISWGVVPAFILIGPDTAARPEQAEAVIAHELAHVRRFDWPVLIAARAALALYWFNPLAWLLVRELVRQAELAADEDAVRQVAPVDYAQTLLAVANRSRAHAHANGMALNQTLLASRIAKVLDGGRPRPARRVALALLLAGGFAASAPLAAMKLVRAEPQGAAVRPAPSPERSAAPIRTASPSDPTMPAAAPTTPWDVVSATEAPQTVPAADAPAVPAVASAPVPVDANVPAPVAVAVVRPRAVSSEPQTAVPESEERQATDEERREAAQERREAAQELREQAAEIYEQANDLERSANETGQPAAARDGMLVGVRNLRNTAKGLEEQAAKLAGS